MKRTKPTRKKAVRNKTGNMPINTLFDKQSPVKKIKRDWEELKPHFIHNGSIYELRCKRSEPKWKGICLYPASSPVKIRSSKCTLISKQEPILKLYYTLIGRIDYLDKQEGEGEGLFEVHNMLKFTKKIILESF